MDLNNYKKQIAKKFEEIYYKDGLILIENIINNDHDDILLKDITASLSKNKKKYTYEIYDYIIKNTNLIYDSIIFINNLLHLCALNGNISLLKHLIKKGININLQDEAGETALMTASQYSNVSSSSIETVKLLLDYGADFNLQNKFGQTALMLAPTYECKNLLLYYDADYNLQNNQEYTALMLAPTNKCEDLIKSYMKN